MGSIIERTDWQDKYGVGRTAAEVLKVIVKLMQASRNSEHKDTYGYYVYASRKTIAKMIKMSVTTVNRCMKELVTAGLFMIRKGIRNSHTYFTDKLKSLLEGEKHTTNEISQDTQMTSRITIGLNKTKDSNLSIGKNENDIPFQSDYDYKYYLKQQAEKAKRTQAKAEKEAKAAKYKRLFQHFMERFNAHNEDDPDNFFTLKHFAEVLAAKLTYSDSISVFGRNVSTDEYYNHITDCEATELLEAAAKTENQQLNTHNIKNTDNYTLAVLFNMV